MFDERLHELTQEPDIVARWRPKGHAQRRVAPILPGIAEAIRIDNREILAIGDEIEAEIGIHPIGGLQHAVQGDDDRSGIGPIGRQMDAIVPLRAVDEQGSLLVGTRNRRGQRKSEHSQDYGPQAFDVAIHPLT